MCGRVFNKWYFCCGEFVIVHIFAVASWPVESVAIRSVGELTGYHIQSVAEKLYFDQIENPDKYNFCGQSGNRTYDHQNWRPMLWPFRDAASYLYQTFLFTHSKVLILVFNFVQESDSDHVVFHAGTALSGKDVVTSGGRVLAVVSVGSSVEETQQSVYKEVLKVCFEGVQYRKDIALKACR